MTGRKTLISRIEVIHEDLDVVVIEKANGVLSYPVPNDPEEGVIQLIRRYWKAQRFKNSHLYLLHRLDKETSGLMVFAKTTLARKTLTRQFENHSIVRGYASVCSAIPKKEQGTIRTFLGRNQRGKRAVSTAGRTAITSYRVEGRNELKQRSLIRSSLHTGRTHQVRIHLAHIGASILGDPIYGNKPFHRIALHAEALGFIHPRTGKPLFFLSSLPEDLKNLV